MASRSQAPIKKPAKRHSSTQKVLFLPEKVEDIDERIAEIVDQDLSPTETARALSEYGVPPTAIVQALNEEFRLPVERIAETLYYADDLSLKELAEVMTAPDGLNMSRNDAVDTLCSLIDGPSYPPGGAMREIDEAMNLSEAEYARGIVVGLNLPMEEATQILNESAIAEVIYAKNSSPVDIAKFLHAEYAEGPAYDTEDGLNLPPREIARIMHEVLNIPADAVAEAMLDENGPHLPVDKEVAQALYHGANMSAMEVAAWAAEAMGEGEVAEILYARDGLDLSLSQVAEALHAPAGLDLSAGEVAQALSQDLGKYPFDVAQALSSGLNLHPSEVAAALSEGLGMDRPGIAKALEDGIGLSPTMAQSAAESVPHTPDHER